MTAPRIISLVFVLFLTTFVKLTAQDTLSAGDKVRVTTEEERVVGYLTAIEGDQLTLDTSLVFPLASVTRLEVHRGQKTSASTVALYTAIGAGSGAVVTAGLVLTGCLLARLVELGCGGPDEELVEGVTPLGFIGIGAGVGALVGALIGATRKTDRWETVPLDRIRVSLTPRGGGLEVSAEFVF